MKNLSKYFIGVAVIVVGLIFGLIIGSGINIIFPNTDKVKEVSIYSDTLVLDNQGEIDLYVVDGGRWLIISLDDLKYIVNKRKTGKETIKNLESLFERFEVPEKVPVKPTFK